MTVAIISHPKCELHDNGSPRHPESPARLTAIHDQLNAADLGQASQLYQATPVSREQLVRTHDAAYVDKVFASAPPEGESIMLDGDTGMNHYTLDAALLAAGAAVMAVDRVMQQKHSHAFCIVRPPGHHAGYAHAAGFCVFNNVAVAAHHAIAEHGIQRVAIVDFDVHHGDGTEAIVANDENILFCSSFQHPFYPYSGADSDYPNVINLPMQAGTPAVDWREQVKKHWLPALDAFQPELIIISAGFDSHLDDFMGGFNLVEDDYVWITHELCRIARDHAQGRVISSLEGGYELSSLGRSTVEHIKALAEV